MQPLNQNFLEALKNKKVDLNLSKRLANTGSTSHRKGSQASSGRGSSPMDTLANVSTLGSTSSKFRVRTLNNNTNTTATEENILGKSSSRLLPPRPTTASRKNEPVKPIHSQAMLSTSTRPSTNQGRRSSQSSKSLLMKSESTRMFEDIDRENDINFLNMDDDNEFDARIREEMEVFNDIADLDEVKLADILNVDVDMLEKMTKAEMKVDLSFNSLQFAGDVMRNLCQLKLNNSIIVSLRDVGNSFPNLKILWVSKCGLQSLAGLSAFPKLQELYAPYNNIKELSDLIFHSHLQVLDLEANEISDINTMFNLMNLDVLNNLTISANPISKIKGYEKQIITEFLPRLELINDKTPEEVNAQDDTEMNDDLDLGGLGGNPERDNNRIQALYDKFEKLHMFSVKEFDSHTRQIILNDMGTEPTEEELIMMSVKKSAKKAKANPLEEDEFGRLSIDVSKSKKKALQRPQSSKGRIGSSKGSSIFTDTDKFKDFGLAASDLTHQAGEAFAGNPLKALRHKRKNQFTSGFENVEGETIAKPKDILKLIEEFEINDESEEDGNKKYDDVFSASLQEGTDNDNDINIDDEIASKSTEKENRTHTEGDLDAIPQHERANSLSQPGTRSLKDDDFKRSLRPVAPRIRVFSQEKRDSIELPSHFPPKDMSMQDIRNQLNSKARVKIQIKTKKAPAIIPVNPANAGRLTSVKVDEVK